MQRTPESQLQSRTRLLVAGVETQGGPKRFGGRFEVASSQPRPSHVPVRKGVYGALDEQLLEQLGGPFWISSHVGTQGLLVLGLVRRAQEAQVRAVAKRGQHAGLLQQVL